MPKHQFRMTYEELQKTAPNVMTTLISLGKAVKDAGLSRELVELVDIRASRLGANLAQLTTRPNHSWEQRRSG